MAFANYCVYACINNSRMDCKRKRGGNMKNYGKIIGIIAILAIIGILVYKEQLKQIIPINLKDSILTHLSDTLKPG